MRRLHVDEMDVETVDLRHELGQRVQLRLAAPPVVLRRPVLREGLGGRELHALRLVVDRLAFRRPPRRDTALKVDDRLFGNLDVERPNGRIRVGGITADAHHRYPSLRVPRGDDFAALRFTDGRRCVIRRTPSLMFVSCPLRSVLATTTRVENQAWPLVSDRRLKGGPACHERAARSVRWAQVAQVAGERQGRNILE
jgi:hypothetical protein